MKGLAALLLLSLSALSLAHSGSSNGGPRGGRPYGGAMQPLSRRAALAEAEPYAYAHAYANAYADAYAEAELYAEGLLRRGSKSSSSSNWVAPKVEGKVIKDTLKCNTKTDKCSGEIITK